MIFKLPRCLFALLMTSSLAAQDIPSHLPVTPMLVSRSAIYAQPLVRPHKGWVFRTLMDYSSAVEVSVKGNRELVLDAELLTVDLWARHDLSPGAFVFADVPVRGAYNGALDKLINAYHHFTGLLVPARDILPVNTYDWHAAFPDTSVVYQRPRGVFLGDIRLGAGWRIDRSQIVASLTLPTATTTIEGWARKTLGTSLAFTTDAFHNDRWNVELGGTYGWTPSTGSLARYQRESFLGAMTSARWRFSGRQAVFATLWTQTGGWHGTGLRTMDNMDLTLDYGGLIKLGERWPELQLGMTEDLYPSGPAIDVGFRIGVRW